MKETGAENPLKVRPINLETPWHGGSVSEDLSGEKERNLIHAFWQNPCPNYMIVNIFKQAKLPDSCQYVNVKLRH